MTIDEIKTISIVDYLRSTGHTPVRHYRDRYWYLSPLHEEKTASFKVDLGLNLWYDFGLQTGGNIINLVKKMHPDASMHDVLVTLEKDLSRGSYAAAPSPPAGRLLPERDAGTLGDTVILEITGLANPHILDYLHSRRIPLAVASRYCQEVHYANAQGRRFYGLGFPNIAGGWEIRNRYYKRSIGTKQISYLRADPQSPAREVCVFEGFFDFLSYMTLQHRGDGTFAGIPRADFLILNSVTMLSKAVPLLKRYPRIRCFLDNDEAGRKATAFMMQNFKDLVLDESPRYAGFKDVNEYLTGR